MAESSNRKWISLWLSDMLEEERQENKPTTVEEDNETWRELYLQVKKTGPKKEHFIKYLEEKRKESRPQPKTLEEINEEWRRHFLV